MKTHFKNASSGFLVFTDTVAAITFNKRAAEELAERLDAALAPLGIPPHSVRVRTFHALGREILRDAGMDVSRLMDRSTLLGELLPDVPKAAHGTYDTAFSRLKLEYAVTGDDVAADPEAGPLARAFVRYEQTLTERDALDFDDLVRRALACLDDDAGLLARWRSRCGQPGGGSATRSGCTRYGLSKSPPRPVSTLSL